MATPHPFLFNRRSFLKTSLSTAALLSLPITRPVSAITPFSRSGPARLLLSLAAYSFRDSFKKSSTQNSAGAADAHSIDMFQFLDFCADHGCIGAEVTSYYFPQDLTTDFLIRLKSHAFLRGIEISGTAVGNNFTIADPDKRAREIAQVKKWIDHAAILGAPHIRVFAGNAKPAEKKEAQRRSIQALEECCQYAGTKGIFLGLENHGGIVGDADSLLEIVQAVKSPWFGVNLDTGNFQTADPYADLVRCAPYAVNVQLKADIQPAGQPLQKADLPRLVRILRDANYQGYVALEYESKENPWTAVPRLLKEMKDLFNA